MLYCVPWECESRVIQARKRYWLQGGYANPVIRMSQLLTTVKYSDPLQFASSVAPPLWSTVSR